MKILFFSLLICVFNVNAQLPETDIFIAPITKGSDNWTIGKPINITNRKGYDNQPFFTPDGKSILYVAYFDTTQSDIFEYEISTKKITRLTTTPESEYSPMLTPSGKKLSCVRVDQDSSQRFYSSDFPPIRNTTLVKGTDSIGYYCWLSDTILAMFILNADAHTLQLLNTNTSQRTVIANNIGRCMKLSSDESSLYFIIKENEKDFYINSMNISDRKLTKITKAFPGTEDFIVMPDQSILMSQGTKLYRWQSSSEYWNEIADLAGQLTGFYRLSVNKAGTWLALVAYTGKRP